VPGIGDDALLGFLGGLACSDLSRRERGGFARRRRCILAAGCGGQEQEGRDQHQNFADTPM